MQDILALDPVQLFQVVVGIRNEIQGDRGRRHGKGDHQGAIIEVIPQKSVGHNANVLDFGEVDGIVVVFQKNRFFADDDAVIGHDNHIKKEIDDLKEEGVDIQNGDNNGRKGEKGIEKGNAEHGDNRTHGKEKHESHEANQQPKNHRL